MQRIIEEHLARRPAARSRSCARAAAGAARVRVPRDAAARDHPGAAETGRAPIYLVNFTQRRAAEQAQNLTSVEGPPARREGGDPRRARRLPAFDTPYGKDFRAFPPPRHRRPPRGPAAQVPRCSSSGSRSRGCSTSSAAPTRWASASTSRSVPCCSPSSGSRRQQATASFLCAPQQITDGPAQRGSTSKGGWSWSSPAPHRQPASSATRQANRKKAAMNQPAKGDNLGILDLAATSNACSARRC